MKKLIVIAILLLAGTAWAVDTQTIDMSYNASRPVTDKELIELWAKNGKICEVLGHQWFTPLDVTTTADAVRAYDFGRWPEKRCCSICGKCQERRMEDWK